MTRDRYARFFPCDRILWRSDHDARERPDVSLESMNNNTSSNNTISVGSRALQILAEAHANAREFFATADVNNAAPVATGYSGREPKIVMVLPPVHSQEADPQVVDLAREMVRAHDCDCVAVFYPVRIDPTDPAAPAEQGVLIEVQAKGQASLKRLLQLKGRTNGRNQFSVALPVLGKSFGVYYPDLLREVA